MNVISNSAFLAASSMLSRFLSLGLIVLLSRVLGPAEMGKYYFAFYLVGFFILFSDLGISSFFVRGIAVEKGKSVEQFNDLLTLKLVLAVLFLAGSFLIIPFATSGSDAALAAYLIAAGTFFQLVAGAYTSFMQAYEHLEYVSIMYVAERLVVTVLTALLIFSMRNVVGVGLAFFAGQLVILLVWFALLQVKLKSYRPSVNLAVMKRFFSIARHSIMFWLSSFFVTVYNRLDVMLLSRLKGSGDAGLYGPGRTLLDSLFFIPSSVNNAAYPLLSRLNRSNRKDAERVYNLLFKYLLLLGLPTAVGVTFLADDAVRLVLGADFIQTAAILKIIIWAEIIIFVSSLSGVLLNAIYKQHLYVVATGIGAFMHVFLVFYLVLARGFIGAAYAAVITEGVVFLISLFFIFRSGYSVHLGNIAKPGFIAAASSIPFFLANPLLASLLFSALYLALALATRALDFRELRELASIRSPSLPENLSEK